MYTVGVQITYLIELRYEKLRKIIGVSVHSVQITYFNEITVETIENKLLAYMYTAYVQIA